MYRQILFFLFLVIFGQSAFPQWYTDHYQIEDLASCSTEEYLFLYKKASTNSAVGTTVMVGGVISILAGVVLYNEGMNANPKNTFDVFAGFDQKIGGILLAAAGGIAGVVGISTMATWQKRLNDLKLSKNGQLHEPGAWQLKPEFEYNRFTGSFSATMSASIHF